MKKIRTHLIPVSKPTIARSARKYILDSLNSGWISVKGPNVEKFEKRFARFVGTKYAVATSCGTSALHLSLASLGIEKGSEVIVPALTMIATVLPIIYQNAIPVLVDSEEFTGNIDLRKIESRINKKTKAIVVVHLHGHPVDVDGVLKIAKKYNIPVIEDAAEAHGARYKNQIAGSLGTVGCFSFYANKIVAIGEGGMITTNDKKIAQLAKSLSNLARSPQKHFLHTGIGFAYRMSNLQASLGLAQLEVITKNIRRKREIGQKYNSFLKNICHIELPIEKQYAKSVYWQYGILLKKDSSVTRNQLEKILEKKGVETRRFFTPMHQQPALKKLGLFKDEHYPIAEDLSHRGLCLPSGLAIKNSEIKYVCNIINQVF